MDTPHSTGPGSQEWSSESAHTTDLGPQEWSSGIADSTSLDPANPQEWAGKRRQYGLSVNARRGASPVVPSVRIFHKEQLMLVFDGDVSGGHLCCVYK